MFDVVHRKLISLVNCSIEQLDLLIYLLLYRLYIDYMNKKIVNK